MKEDQKNLAYSKELARRYSDLGRKYTSSDKKLLSLLPSLKNKKVLDLGCGNGSYSEKLSKRGIKRVVGIDSSKEMIALARSYHEKTGVHFLVGEASRIPGRKEEYDVIFCRFVFHYLKNMRPALWEVRRVLKPGGTLLAILNCFDAPVPFRGKIVPVQLGKGNDVTNIRIYCHSPQQVMDNIKKAGLKSLVFKSALDHDAHVNPMFEGYKTLRPLAIIFLAQKKEKYTRVAKR